MIKHLILLSLIALSLQIDNCHTSSETCKSCFTGYKLVELNNNKADCVDETTYNDLQKKMPGCYKEDLATQKCSECLRGYVLTTDKKNCTKIDHCSSVDGENTCDNCYTPFVLDGSTCKENLLCKEMTSGKCSKCRLYYHPDSDGNCKRIKIEHCPELDGEKCKYCENLYYKDDDDKKCTPYPDNCVKVESKKCTQCKTKFYPDTEGKTCVSYPANCAQIDDSHKCSQCDVLYYKNNEGNCIKNPDGCYTYDPSKDECGSCLSGYYEKNKKCIKIGIANCASSTDEGTTCANCEQNYYKDDDDKKCTPYPENCITVVSKKCTQCKDKFYPDAEGKNCLNYPNGCYTYDSATDECGTCLGGFYKKDKRCNKIGIAYCLTTEDEGKTCQNCEPDCKRSDDKTQCNKICQAKETYCETCESNYDSYDYGKTCKVLDPDLIPKDEPKDNSRFINLNLLISALILSLII